MGFQPSRIFFSLSNARTAELFFLTIFIAIMM